MAYEISPTHFLACQFTLIAHLSPTYSMVNSRIFIAHTGFESRLRARMYSSSSNRPCTVQVITCDEGPTARFSRYPQIESNFNPKPQPHIHNCTVGVWDGQRFSQFAVFYKQHRRLPLNRSLPPMHNRSRSSVVRFHGDFLVLRVAHKNINSYVNMRERDPALSDFLVTRLAKHIMDKRGNKPTALTLVYRAHTTRM